MNNLMQQRWRQNNLNQQGANMLMQQQQDFNNWYHLGNSIGGAFFHNMANGANDGKYGDSIVMGSGKTDKENFEMANKYQANIPSPDASIYDFAQGGSNISSNVFGENGMLANGQQAISANDFFRKRYGGGY